MGILNVIHTLTVKHRNDKSSTVALFEYITSDHKICPIHQLLLKLKLMETTLLCCSKTVVTSLECAKQKQAHHPYKNTFGFMVNKKLITLVEKLVEEFEETIIVLIFYLELKKVLVVL